MRTDSERLAAPQAPVQAATYRSIEISFACALSLHRFLPLGVRPIKQPIS
jgi:hypothetical protein